MYAATTASLHRGQGKSSTLPRPMVCTPSFRAGRTRSGRWTCGRSRLVQPRQRLMTGCRLSRSAGRSRRTCQSPSACTPDPAPTSLRRGWQVLSPLIWTKWRCHSMRANLKPAASSVQEMIWSLGCR
uniref:Uncharacterized protein n=1 Tax=Zea mays TaxID=4577 RepID=B4FC62_MAIZE|nr:unknown [Zea mays]